MSFQNLGLSDDVVHGVQSMGFLDPTEIQLQAFVDVPYIPLGQMFAATAYRANLTGMLGGFALFWNVRRATT